jgi:hypothetical protein
MKSVKESLHNLIDTIGNEDLLKSVYEILSLNGSDKPGKIWDTLTYAQRDEVLEAAKTLGDPDQLPHQAMIEKNKQWLTK